MPSAAAAAAKSCPTLCDPIDGCAPGSSVHGILQARTLAWVAISFSNACMHAKSPQSCPTLCDPMDISPPGSSVHGILQASMLEWGAISFFRYAPNPAAQALRLASSCSSQTSPSSPPPSKFRCPASLQDGSDSQSLRGRASTTSWYCKPVPRALPCWFLPSPSVTPWGPAWQVWSCPGRLSICGSEPGAHFLWPLGCPVFGLSLRQRVHPRQWSEEEMIRTTDVRNGPTTAKGLRQLA